MSETTTNRTNQSATTATLAGYEIPRLGMGTMALAIEGRPSNRNQAIETIHAALDAGVRYLDTAWSYYLPSAPGTGEPEDMGYGEYLVRDALHSWHGPKDQVLVATKTGWLRTLDGNGNYGWQADARPETNLLYLLLRLQRKSRCQLLTVFSVESASHEYQRMRIFYDS